MTTPRIYDTNLAMGLGLVSETKVLLHQWTPGLSPIELFNSVLGSGLLAGSSAYRLRNLVVRCFADRYLNGDAPPAQALKRLMGVLSSQQFTQLLYLHTCRANPILHDFISEVFWPAYAGGSKTLLKQTAEEFVRRAIDDGKTPSRWAEGQIERVGRYLTGCCADFGLLGSPSINGRTVMSMRAEESTVLYLAHDLHFKGVGNNALLTHEDWQLFGMAREDVLAEMKRLSLKGLLIVQAAGDVIRISWKQPDMEALCDVIAQG